MQLDLSADTRAALEAADAGDERRRSRPRSAARFAPYTAADGRSRCPAARYVAVAEA